MFKIDLNTNTKEEQKEYEDRIKRNKKILSDYYRILNSVMDRSNEPSVQKHKERGKLLARERINMLVDQGTPFLELSTLAAFDQYENQFPSAGIVTGIGTIHGHKAVIIGNDATVKGGTYVKETIKKHLRAQEVALDNHLPCVYMVDSGGVFLPDQAEVFPDKNDFGRIFYNQARLSAENIPQIAIVMGSCTAGGAYVPAMSDETIIIQNQGTIFLGGPPLVQAATGDIVTAEELGGAEVHTSVSGVADHLAYTDEHAIEICRNIFQSFPKQQKKNITAFENPKYPEDGLYNYMPISPREQVDAYDIIARIVDSSEFHEFKKKYGSTLVTGFASIKGIKTGIIANSGILFSESALKGTHFIELCNHRKIPILFLQNISGFMVGKEYENKGIAKDGAKFVHAVANASVPKITIIFGGSYGAGNYAMGGRAYSPRFLFMWPNAKISVMGGEQAANVLVTIKNEQQKKAGKALTNEESEKIRNSILKKYEHESSAYYSTSRLWDDGIIDPAETRNIVAMALDISLNKPIGEPKTGVYRM